MEKGSIITLATYNIWNSNEGMPIIRSKRKGDLFVRFVVETPVNLNKRQKELLEEFRSLSKDENCQPQTKGFMDKIKDLFSSVA